MSAEQIWSFHPVKPGDDMVDIVPKMVARQREIMGAVFFRATLVDRHSRPLEEGQEAAGVYLEGWRERPADQGPFDPRLMGRNLEIEP